MVAVDLSLVDLGDVDVSPTELSQRDGIRRFSNSEVQTFKRCRRKWWLAYYRRLQPRRKTYTGAMAIGTRIHLALQYHYQSRVPESRFVVNADDALETLIALDRELFMGDPGLTDESLIKFSREADLERIMIDGYLQWLAETGEDSNYEIVGAEVYREAQLTEPLVNTYVALIARLDLRVRRLTDRAVLFLDHKTTGAFSQLTETLGINEQMMWYILVESLADTSYRVHGALYNMIRRVKRTASARPPFYARQTVWHNSIQLDNFLTRVKGVIEVILTTERRLENGDSHRRVVYPSPTRDCTWDCPFFTPCQMMDDGSYAEEMLDREFTVGDPLGYYVRDKVIEESDRTK